MKWKKVIALCTGVILIGGLAGCTQPQFTQDDVDAAYDQGVSSVKPITETVTVTETVEVPADVTSNDAEVIATATAADKAEIARIQAVLDDYELEGGTKLSADNSYVIDELEIGQTFLETLSDREISLFDDEVKFDGDKYDMEEIFYLEATPAVNEEDFDSDSYLQLLENGIVYENVFENSLDTSKIDSDETLTFGFLGEEVEVSSWDVDTITFTSGTTELLGEGETSADGKVLVQAVGETGDKGYAKILVNDVVEILKVGDTEEIGGLEVSLREVFLNDEDDQLDYAELKIAEDVEFEVEDGDEYDGNDAFEWIIGPNLIGLKLVEDFTDLDKDYKPLAAGEELCLPNNYICVGYNGLEVDETHELTFEDDNNYDVEVLGDFLVGLEDYNRVYVNASGIYDDDDVLLGQSVEIEDSDLNLELKNGNRLVVENFKLWLDFSDLKVDGNSIASIEDTYVSKYGLVIEDPEDDLEDKDVTLIVPEDQSEASVSIY